MTRARPARAGDARPLRPSRRRRVRLPLADGRGGVGDRGGVPDRRVAHDAARRGRRRRVARARRRRRGARTSTCASSISPAKLAVPLAAFNASRFDVVVVAPRLGGGDGRDRRGARDLARRGARPARRARAEPLRAVARRRLGARRHGVVNPSSMLLAAAMMLEHGLGATVAGADARGRRLGGARRRAADARSAAPRRRRDDAEFTTRVVGGFQLARKPSSGAGAA